MRWARRASRRFVPRCSTHVPASSGAIMLGFGRALGETMAVTMVIGNNPRISMSLFAPQYTMAAVLANEFSEAASELYLNALDRNRARALHHHADREFPVAPADLEHGEELAATAEPTACSRRVEAASMTHTGCRKAHLVDIRGLLRAVGAGGAGAAGASSSSSSSARASRRSISTSSRTCRIRSASRAAAWRTPSSAR